MDNLLTKTTKNYAESRDIYASVFELDDHNYLTLVSNKEAELSDAQLMYLANTDGSFSYYGNTWLSHSEQEELPATIRDETHLRLVISYLSSLDI